MDFRIERTGSIYKDGRLLDTLIKEGGTVLFWIRAVYAATSQGMLEFEELTWENPNLTTPLWGLVYGFARVFLSSVSFLVLFWCYLGVFIAQVLSLFLPAGAMAFFCHPPWRCRVFWFCWGHSLDYTGEVA